MRRWNGAIVSAFLLMILAGTTFAADLKVNGEYRVRGYYYSDTDGNGTTLDSSDYFDQRFLLKGIISQGITTGVFEMQMVNSPSNGQGGYILGTGPPFGGQLNYNGTSNQGVGIYQAYLSAKWSGATLNAGRQELKLGHGMAFYSTVDGFTMAFPMEFMELTAGYLKIKEANSFKTGASTDTDENALLFSLVTKSSGSNFGAFYLSDSDKSYTSVSGSDSTTNIFGFFMDSAPGPSGVAIEYDNISGQDGCVFNNIALPPACTLPAGAAPLNRVGTNLFVGGHASMGSIITGIAYIRATGAGAGSTTDVSYNSLGGGGDFTGGHGVLFYNPTNFHNGVDFNGMEKAWNITTGIHAVRLSADFVPNPLTIVSIQYFPFVHMTDVLPGSGDNVGTEFNLSVDYTIDKNLKVNTVYAYFGPGDGIQPVSPTTIMEFHAGLTFTF
ncbi:MAG TPA: hypothetical protein VN944_09630 [Nitrospiria bacterium]|nr:hypothetical protein [Nitrospiria bacterium]